MRKGAVKTMAIVTLQQNRRAARAALLVCFALWPCLAAAEPHTSKAEYKKIFVDAITKSLASQKGYNTCLPQSFFLGPGQDSMDLSQRALELMPTAPAGQAAQLNALEEVGLLTSTPSQRTINNKMESFKTYRKTEKGQRYFSENRFCYGRAELNKIVKWKGPAVFGEYKIAWVYYTVKVSDVADWALAPSILAAFPAAKSTLQDEPDKVRQVFIDLSSEGWEVNEWSKVLQ
jgi:hypothetical protein